MGLPGVSVTSRGSLSAGPNGQVAVNPAMFTEAMLVATRGFRTLGQRMAAAANASVLNSYQEAPGMVLMQW